MATGVMPEFGLNIVNLYAPPGTRIPMQQVAPPLGWTSDVSAAFTDCSMRINSGSGGGAGGTLGWSGWNFGGTFNNNAFTLGIGNLPPHSHGINDPGHVHGVNDPGHGHGVGDPGHQHNITAQNFQSGNSVFLTPNWGGSGLNHSTDTGFTGISIGVNGSNISLFGAATGISTQNTGSGASFTSSYTTPQVKYADHIIAVKS